MDKPDPITTDYRGTTIAAGSLVAYNYSGYVKLGRIVELKRNTVYLGYGRIWRHKFELRIQNLRDPSRVSVVKNPLSFVILENLPQ